MLLVHALVDAEAALSLPIPGLHSAALRFADCAGLRASVEDVAAPPPLAAPLLHAFDTLLRALAGSVAAVLPVRYGTVVADEAELARLLEPRRKALAEALSAVAGMEQMTVWVVGIVEAAEPAPLPSGSLAARRSAVAPGGGAAAGESEGIETGTAYLERRAHERSLPAAAALRASTASIVVAERCEVRSVPGLLGSVFHLIRRGGAEDYRARAANAIAPEGVRYAVTGPWPAYAFGPEIL